MELLLAPNRQMRDIVAEEMASPDIQLDEPLTVEPPLTKKHGVGSAKFTCTVAVSTLITGNGIAGHDRLTWDRRFRDQIDEARKNFFKLIDIGYHAFRVNDKGKPTQRLLAFDPNAEEIYMTSPVAAG
jgi:hypothetical protein